MNYPRLIFILLVVLMIATMLGQLKAMENENPRIGYKPYIQSCEEEGCWNRVVFMPIYEKDLVEVKSE